MALKDMSQTTVHLTVCNICTDTTQSGEAGIGGGSRLHELLLAQLAGHPYRDRLNIQTLRCLMACSEGCVVSLAQPGKMQYLLGRLPADTDMAAQILEFAGQYAESPTGVVPNHLWPDTLGLHFLGRIPPLEPNPDSDWSEQGCNL